MPQPTPPGFSTQAPLAATAPSDHELIRRIGSQRDEAAFTVLLKRYQEMAYSLAFRITLSRELAEEAIQEAFLSIWANAFRFKPGEARPWILAIVTNASLRAMRVQRHRNRPLTSQELRGEHRLPESMGTDEQEHQHLEALRRLLGSLTPRDRQLLALYYGSGMTQQQIACALGVTQRTVSNRIQAVVQRLRTLACRASGGGLILAGSDLEEHLARLLGEPTLQAPSAMIEQVLCRARTWARSPRSQGWRKGRLTLATATVLGVLALAAVHEYGPAPSENEISATVPSGWGREVPATRSGGAPASPLPLRWDFRSSPPTGLETFGGTLLWMPGIGPQGGSAMPDTLTGLLIHLPHRLPADPLQIEIDGKIPGLDPWGLHLYWNSLEEADLAKAWSRWLSLPASSIENLRRARIFRIFLWDRYLVHCLDGKAYQITSYPRHTPASSLVMSLKNVALQQIRIERLQRDDLPMEFRDPLRTVEQPGWTAGSIDDLGEPSRQWLRSRTQKEPPAKTPHSSAPGHAATRPSSTASPSPEPAP